jgi:hypothetical protein
VSRHGQEGTASRTTRWVVCFDGPACIPQSEVQLEAIKGASQLFYAHLSERKWQDSEFFVTASSDDEDMLTKVMIVPGMLLNCYAECESAFLRFRVMQVFEKLILPTYVNGHGCGCRVVVNTIRDAVQGTGQRLPCAWFTDDLRVVIPSREARVRGNAERQARHAKGRGKVFANSRGKGGWNDGCLDGYCTAIAGAG